MIMIKIRRLMKVVHQILHRLIKINQRNGYAFVVETKNVASVLVLKKGHSPKKNGSNQSIMIPGMRKVMRKRQRLRRSQMSGNVKVGNVEVV